MLSWSPARSALRRSWNESFETRERTPDALISTGWFSIAE